MVLAIADLVLALVVAGATAIGAAIGGAITGAVTLEAEDKRQAFSRELEQRRTDQRTADRLAELRVAVRRVADELGALGGRVKAAQQVAMTPMSLPRASWDAHREASARVLSIGAWTEVSRAYGGLEVYRPALEEGRTVAPDPLPGLLRDIEAALQALVPYAAGASLPVEVDMPSLPDFGQAAESPPEGP